MIIAVKCSFGRGLHFICFVVEGVTFVYVAKTIVENIFKSVCSSSALSLLLNDCHQIKSKQLPAHFDRV